MHTIGKLGARRIDAAGDAHALVFLERPRVEHDQLGAFRLQLAQLSRSYARRLVALLDELAEGL
jgi:hypothetical protein